MIIEIIAGVTLIWLTWTDWKARLIPNTAIALLFLCGIVNLLLKELQLLDALLGLLVLGVPVLLLSVLWGHGTAIGGGDVKLCAVMGFLLGPIPGCMTIYLSFLFLALCGLIIRRKALPFAPFVLPAYCIIFLLRRVLHV